METFRFHPNLFINADRRRPLSESLVGAVDYPGPDVVVIEEDAGFPQERWEARRVGKILLKFLVPAIADVGEAVGNTDDLVAVGLSFYERNEVDVAVRRNRAPNAGPHQNDSDEISPAAATNVAQGHCDKLFEPRLFYRIRLFRRFWSRQEFCLQFF